MNVLQSMILTDQEGTGHMVLTPTYHVFQMYTPFQEATYLPLDLQCDEKKVQHDWKKAIDESNPEKGYRALPMVAASAAKTADGSMVLSLTNVSLEKAQEVSVDIDGATAKSVTGRILTCKEIGDYNDFEHPDRVAPKDFKDAKLKKGKLTVKVPARSIVVLTLK